MQFMPVSYRSRIEGLKGVRAVTQAEWIDARYNTEDTVFSSFSLDPRLFDTKGSVVDLLGRTKSVGWPHRDDGQA